MVTRQQLREILPAAAARAKQKARDRRTVASTQGSSSKSSLKWATRPVALGCFHMPLLLYHDGDESCSNIFGYTTKSGIRNPTVFMMSVWVLLPLAARRMMLLGWNCLA